ncbi:MAG TPA: LytTR family DNA-binding domain-containing protein [Rhizomicrobium sp.]|nr:LytTR family DNA-binding domain-containing protein [Rhizomicrobium sp.]
MKGQNGLFPRPAEYWQEAALGFAYWLALVLVLEPGNIARAFDSGGRLPVGREIVRLIGAASIGSLATLAVFALVRRWPLDGEDTARRVALHIFADAGIAVLMIAVAGILAAFLLMGSHGSLLMALGSQLAVDGPILYFCLLILTAIAHGVRGLRVRRAQAEARAGYLKSVTARSRNRTDIVDLSGVSWIQTQGNYLALRVGDAVHLIRETSRNFETRIDPKRFLRIHRQTIVAVDAIRRVDALESGDAIVILSGGIELRASRNYRDALRERLSDERIS